MPWPRRDPSTLVEADYSSSDVAIPQWFLTGHPPPEMKLNRIDFANSTIPEYHDLYALVIDDAFTLKECELLIKMAETSAEGHGGWRPAMVRAGANRERLLKDYRDSDRIIWDQAEVMGRIWERCLCAPGLREEMAVVDGSVPILGSNGRAQKWEFTRPNERMRFLRYGAGQFFSAHCDGSYRNPDPTKVERTLFTIQVYLNDDGVEGGATTFLSPNRERKIDVEPKRGRVLLFQHRDLLHTGSEVKEGSKFKYTMRSDLLYELVENKKQKLNQRS